MFDYDIKRGSEYCQIYNVSGGFKHQFQVQRASPLIHNPISLFHQMKFITKVHSKSDLSLTTWEAITSRFKMASNYTIYLMRQS